MENEVVVQVGSCSYTDKELLICLNIMKFGRFLFVHNYLTHPVASAMFCHLFKKRGETSTSGRGVSSLKIYDI